MEKSQLKEKIKEYSLPKFEELEALFSISEVSEDLFNLTSIRHKIVDKINYFSKLLEGILQPEADIQSLYECKDINEEKTKKVFKIYKQLKILERESDILDLESNDERDKKFITESFNKWKDLKDEISEILNNLKACWTEEEDDLPPTSHYVG